MTEYWKDIIGYEGLYSISNYGRVLSCGRRSQVGNGAWRFYERKILKPEMMKLGYLRIQLSKYGISKKVLIHVLVGRHFLENIIGKEINHKDGNKLNNWVGNLEYVTKSENALHRYRVLKKSNKRLSKCT